MGDLAVGFDDGGRFNWGNVNRLGVTLSVYGDRPNRSNYGEEYDAGTSVARRQSGVT
ncbi:UNVERIFIED_ORG: hypothetical protein ABID33_003245 [Xanthobacter viscosus]|jgi:hypothetical protein|uniref:hypothetical protein n=1 Tax=Xanthobacter autotrophicus TaxID=280 RepID=UPI00147709EF|nr:hypothetical protein [Xanthobacter autotrophicus]